MKELIKKDNYGMFADMNDTARVDSLYVAKYFEKEHRHVLRDIDNLLKPGSGLSKEFNQSNFGQIKYKDAKGRSYRAYAMTRDGFTLLVMGYHGAKANHFKELYIKRFNEMEQTIKSLENARSDFPKLTEQIKIVFKNPKPYFYSNECNMINKIVLGMTAKQFKQINNIDDSVTSIRPYLTDKQLEMLDRSQMIDLGLLISTPDYSERKRLLEIMNKEYR